MADAALFCIKDLNKRAYLMLHPSFPHPVSLSGSPMPKGSQQLPLRHPWTNQGRKLWGGGSHPCSALPSSRLQVFIALNLLVLCVFNKILEAFLQDINNS